MFSIIKRIQDISSDLSSLNQTKELSLAEVKFIEESFQQLINKCSNFITQFQEDTNSGIKTSKEGKAEIKIAESNKIRHSVNDVNDFDFDNFDNFDDWNDDENDVDSYNNKNEANEAKMGSVSPKQKFSNLKNVKNGELITKSCELDSDSFFSDSDVNDTNVKSTNTQVSKPQTPIIQFSKADFLENLKISFEKLSILSKQAKTYDRARIFLKDSIQNYEHKLAQLYKFAGEYSDDNKIWLQSNLNSKLERNQDFVQASIDSQTNFNIQHTPEPTCQLSQSQSKAESQPESEPQSCSSTFHSDALDETQSSEADEEPHDLEETKYSEDVDTLESSDSIDAIKSEDSSQNTLTNTSMSTSSQTKFMLEEENRFQAEISEQVHQMTQMLKNTAKLYTNTLEKDKKNLERIDDLVQHNSQSTQSLIKKQAALSSKKGLFGSYSIRAMALWIAMALIFMLCYLVIRLFPVSKK